MDTYQFIINPDSDLDFDGDDLYRELIHDIGHNRHNRHNRHNAQLNVMQNRKTEQDKPINICNKNGDILRKGVFLRTHHKSL